MAPMASLCLFSFLTLLYIAGAQERAPHGLANENPIAFSPSAFEFFHPKTQQPTTRNPCDTSSCSPLPLAAQVESTQARESKVSTSKAGQSRVGAGGIAGIVFGFVFVVLLAMGVYYVVSTRRANMSRTNTVLPDA